MPAAPAPIDEAERMRALRASGLLESGPDPALDAIVRRAAALFAAPIAAISLVCENTQRFKAAVGLGVPHTSREVAFCAYTILQSGPLVVLDAACDRRFADNPLVTGAPCIRTYIGAPLLAPSGHRLGALCVIDTVPRAQVTSGELDALCAMAAEAASVFRRYVI